eukprot:5436187-Pleurochrysis_carterae.AAC.1
MCTLGGGVARAASSRARGQPHMYPSHRTGSARRWLLPRAPAALMTARTPCAPARARQQEGPARVAAARTRGGPPSAHPPIGRTAHVVGCCRAHRRRARQQACIDRRMSSAGRTLELRDETEHDEGSSRA